jgi:hypothetical protein
MTLRSVWIIVGLIASCAIGLVLAEAIAGLKVTPSGRNRR